MKINEELLKECIYLYECDKNTHYDINPDIIMIDHHKWFGDGNNITVEYKVEYISKLDTKWRKWYEKKSSFSLDGLKPHLRENRLNKILGNPDN